MHTPFDLGNKFSSVGSARGFRVKMKGLAGAPGDGAGAEEWVSNGAVTPRCQTRPEGDKMRRCV